MGKKTKKSAGRSTVKDKIKGYMDENKSLFEGILGGLEERIIKGREREDDPVPIHLTKYRVKSARSLFGKYKRKKDKRKNEFMDDVEGIATDLLGIRVICLFDQDLEKVYKFLVDEVLVDETLIELKVYTQRSLLMAAKIIYLEYDGLKEKKADEFIGSVTTKESKYQSIHFVFNYTAGSRVVKVEMQLRTVLQDVWAELEHALAYKQGMINSQIRDSFNFLQGDLDNIGRLLDGLKAITIKDRELARLQMRSTARPIGVFWYESELLPSVFSSEGDLSRLVTEYRQEAVKAQKEEKIAVRNELIKNGKSILSNLLRKLSETKNVDPGQHLYFKNVENAFWMFLERKFDEALDLYEQISNSNRDKYVPMFRKGEIHYLLGDMEDALVCFDRAETILDSMYKKHMPNEVAANKYRILNKLAITFWQMGRDYDRLALEKISEAEITFKLIKEPEKVLGRKEEPIIANNLTWFYLSEFLRHVDNQKEVQACIEAKVATQKEVENLSNKIIPATKQAFNALIDKFEILWEFLDSTETASNSLDTASWFYYKTYEAWEAGILTSEDMDRLRNLVVRPFDLTYVKV